MADRMQIAIVDCETTGLDTHDQPISIAVFLCQIDELGFGNISDTWYGEQHPNVPISAGAFSVHGRTRESLIGKTFDLDGLARCLSSAQLIIAHNAEFDSRMIGKAFPKINEFAWFCSYKQWPFGKLPNKRLDTLCDHFKIEKPFKHDAASDAKCLHEVLMKRQGKTTRSKTYLHKLIQNSAWIAASNESSTAREPVKPSIKIHSFDQEEIRKISAGSRIQLEGNSYSDRLTAFRRNSFFQRKPVLTILKSENAVVAERFDSQYKIFVVVTKNDAYAIELDFQADEPVV